MHHRHVIALERQRQPAEEGERVGALLLPREELLERQGRLVLADRLWLAPEPSVAMLALLGQQVELVVAQDALRRALRHEVAHEAQHARGVRPTIHQVANEDKPPPVGMPAVAVVAEPVEEHVQRTRFAVDVADDVYRPSEERSDERVLRWQRLRPRKGGLLLFECRRLLDVAATAATSLRHDKAQQGAAEHAEREPHHCCLLARRGAVLAPPNKQRKGRGVSPATPCCVPTKLHVLCAVS